MYSKNAKERVPVMVCTSHKYNSSFTWIASFLKIEHIQPHISPIHRYPTQNDMYAAYGRQVVHTWLDQLGWIIG